MSRQPEPPEVRLVPLTREQRDWLAEQPYLACEVITDAWDAEGSVDDLGRDRVSVRVWMTTQIRDQLLAEGGSKPVHPMRLVPDEDGFQLVFMSASGVLTEDRPLPVVEPRDTEQQA